MNNQDEKKIEYNPDFWKIGKRSRKNTTRSNDTRKPKAEPTESPQETQFSNQLSHLTNLMNMNTVDNPSWGNLKNGKLPTYREYINNNNQSKPTTPENLTE